MYASILFFNLFFILVKWHLHVGEYQKINTYSDYFSGVCKCSSSYIGMDCSHAKSIPPMNFSLPENGVCKTSQRACTKTNIFGHFHSENVMAKLEEFHVMKFLRIFLKILSFILCWFILQKLFSNSIRKLFKNIIKNVTFRNERKLLKIYTHQVFKEFIKRCFLEHSLLVGYVILCFTWILNLWTKKVFQLKQFLKFYKQFLHK